VIDGALCPARRWRGPSEIRPCKLMLADRAHQGYRACAPADPGTVGSGRSPPSLSPGDGADAAAASRAPRGRQDGSPPDPAEGGVATRFSGGSGRANNVNKGSLRGEPGGHALHGLRLARRIEPEQDLAGSNPGCSTGPQNLARIAERGFTGRRHLPRCGDLVSGRHQWSRPVRQAAVMPTKLRLPEGG